MRKRVFVFAIIILLIIIGAVFLLSMRTTPKPEAPSAPAVPVTQTPEPTTSTPKPTFTPTPSAQNKQAAISKLPYIGDGFTIEYFPDRDWFFIQINKPPYETYEAAAKQWFQNKGLDLESLNVEWGSTRGIAPKP